MGSSPISGILTIALSISKCSRNTCRSSSFRLFFQSFIMFVSFGSQFYAKAAPFVSAVTQSSLYAARQILMDLAGPKRKRIQTAADRRCIRWKKGKGCKHSLCGLFMDKYEVLRKYFGYPDFREGQEILIDSILSGQDVLGIMPTGAGKSICYQVPALLLSGITLVISPLISLMKDQVQALNQAGIHAAYINSSLSESQISKALRLASAGQYKMIYVAPERLETYEFLQFALRAEIAMVTVDEAHCISQWGQDFRPSYLKIVQFIRQLWKRPVLSAFTATATEKVKDDIVCVLGLNRPQVLVTGFDRKNLYFAVETPRKKDDYVMAYVQEHREESGIIYCATRKNADQVCEHLKAQGIAATKYHAGLGGEERRQNQEAFIYDQSLVMVATNAFGMGIDKSNVRYVIHYNMPQSLENYYQEAGRAGRDGERAECILLYHAQDVAVNRYLIENKAPDPERTREEIAQIRERDEERLQVMTYYCMTTNCLREYILRYFGEKIHMRCENCSSCNREYEEVDVTQAAQKIIACILDFHQRYGMNVISGTLAGANRAKLRDYGAFEHETYASLREMSEQQIKQIIHQMLADGLLWVTNDKYALLKVSQEADEVRRGVRRVIWKQVKAETQKAAGGNTSSRKMRKSDILNSKGLELFERLRILRTEIAREESLPPYIIFSDKTLVDMCVKAPLEKQEMMQVNGVGENKYARFGERFLAAVRDYTGGVREKYYFGDAGELAAQASAAQEGRQKAVHRKRKVDFYLTSEQAAQFPYAEKYLAAEIGERLNQLRDPETAKKTSGAELLRKLQAMGYAGQTYQDGMRRRYVTEKGKAAGLFIGPRISKKGTEYEDIYFNPQAQQMIVSMVSGNGISEQSEGRPVDPKLPETTAAWAFGTEIAGQSDGWTTETGVQEYPGNWEEETDLYLEDERSGWSEEPDEYVPADWRSEYGFI